MSPKFAVGCQKGGCCLLRLFPGTFQWALILTHMLIKRTDLMGKERLVYETFATAHQKSVAGYLYTV